ncbi:MAG TPA: FlgD immunoglobulin-like domain containing protein [Candidatus Eisenbacteria bacterium]|nr:FlgD immunoglobulin-like domain containing protein [Candidatus Eisenbacteria bacterium]
MIPFPLRRLVPPTLPALLALSTLVPAPAHAASVLLHWTAPGDDGRTGTALRYDVRRSTQPITLLTWTACDTVAGLPAPALAGTRQSVPAVVPAGSPFVYFALRTLDHAGNWSGLSNVAVVATTLDTPAVDVETALSPAWPSPARTRASLRLTLAQPGPVTVEVLDAAGRHVAALAHGPLPAGIHDLAWDLRDDAGRAAPPGVYFVRAEAAGRPFVRRVIATR